MVATVVIPPDPGRPCYTASYLPPRASALDARSMPVPFVHDLLIVNKPNQPKPMPKLVCYLRPLYFIPHLFIRWHTGTFRIGSLSLLADCEAVAG